MDIKEEFGKRLKQLRQGKKLTQAELAEKAGVSAQMISSYEKGQKEPGLSSAVMIASALGVSIERMISAGDSLFSFKNELETYGDIFRMLSTIEANLSVTFGFEEGEDFLICNKSHKSPDTALLRIEDQIIADFSRKFMQMKRLLMDKTISLELFRSWLEGEILKGDSEQIPIFPF